MTFLTNSEADTTALAARVAPMLAAGDAVLLEGDLGAGKSVFARGIARGMGLKTRATVEEAIEDAKRKFVGDNPNILALPKTFTTAAVHLCMKNPEENSHYRDSAPAHPCGG